MQKRKTKQIHKVQKEEGTTKKDEREKTQCYMRKKKKTKKKKNLPEKKRTQTKQEASCYRCLGQICFPILRFSFLCVTIYSGFHEPPRSEDFVPAQLFKRNITSANEATSIINNCSFQVDLASDLIQSLPTPTSRTVVNHESSTTSIPSTTTYWCWWKHYTGGRTFCG